MFRLLLLVSCLGFVVGCGEGSDPLSIPTASDPLSIPTASDPLSIPTAEESKIWVGDATEDDLDMLISGLYTDVTGALIIRGSQIDTIALPQLKTVGGSLGMGFNGNLTSIDLPRLQSVGDGFIKISNNVSLTSIDLPQLQTVGGDLIIIEKNPLFTDCDLGSYTEQYCP